MYTQAGLIQIAVSSDAEHAVLFQRHPAGTYDEGRNEARRRRDDALVCAAWMEANGFSELAYVGPFEGRVFKRGEHVRIKKGSKIFSMEPRVGRDGLVAKRDYVVTVHDHFHGYMNSLVRAENGDPTVVQATIHWAGTGGYWRWTDANNVEIAEAASAAA